MSEVASNRERRPMLAYMEDPAPHRSARIVRFSDLIALREPEFAFLEVGGLLLTLRGDTARAPIQRWEATAVHELQTWEETGDALVFRLHPRVHFQAVRVPGHSDLVIRPREMRDALNWAPSPAPFFKAFPRAAWVWLRQVKGLPLPEAT